MSNHKNIIYIYWTDHFKFKNKQKADQKCASLGDANIVERDTSDFLYVTDRKRSSRKNG